MPAQEPASQFIAMGSRVNARDDSGFFKMPEFFILVGCLFYYQ